MIHRLKSRLAALGLCACCAFNVAPRPSANALGTAPAHKIVTGGVFVMLREQRAGAFVLDARTQGRSVPDAVTAPSPANAADLARQVPVAARVVVLLGDGERVVQAARLLSTRPQISRVLMVPARLLEAPDRRGVRQLSPLQLHDKLRHETRPILLDFSERDEWNAAHLRGSRHIETARLLRGDRSFLPSRSRPVFVTCVAGHRSQLAAQVLGREGFKVWNLRGGVMNWQSCGLPIEQGSHES